MKKLILSFCSLLILLTYPSTAKAYQLPLYGELCSLEIRFDEYVYNQDDGRGLATITLVDGLVTTKIYIKSEALESFKQIASEGKDICIVAKANGSEGSRTKIVNTFLIDSDVMHLQDACQSAKYIKIALRKKKRR